MSKKDFIALADMIRDHNRIGDDVFTDHQIEALAAFCKRENYAFKRERWIGYIKGENGQNGGAIKKTAA